MHLVKHKPAARGVSHLMYVGDAEVAPSIPTVVKVAIACVVAWFVFRK